MIILENNNGCSSEKNEEGAFQKNFFLRNLANIFTLARLALIPVTAYALIRMDSLSSEGHFLALSLFWLAAVTDFIDGQIARRTDTESEFGRIADPLADRMLAISTLLILLFRSLIPIWMAILVIARDVLIVAAAPLIGLKKENREQLNVHWTGKLATALLFLGLCFFIMYNTKHHVNEAGFAIFTAGIVFSYFSGFIYVHKGITLIRNNKKDT